MCFKPELADGRDGAFDEGPLVLDSVLLSWSIVIEKPCREALLVRGHGRAVAQSLDPLRRHACMDVEYKRAIDVRRVPRVECCAALYARARQYVLHSY